MYFIAVYSALVSISVPFHLNTDSTLSFKFMAVLSVYLKNVFYPSLFSIHTFYE